MTDSALLIDGVRKSYANHPALQGVSLNVEPGERVALLGHNGAGKTTLMKLILSLISPDAGEISIAGMTPSKASSERAVAYLPEAVSFHRALTGREQLTLFARLAGSKTSVVEPLLNRVGLSGALDRRIGTWSKGMRQRLGLAQVLLGNPRVALLDEPTSGLDPVSRHDLYDIVDELANDGAAVLIASHALTEVEARTDRIVIMRSGQIVANDTLSALRRDARLPTRIRLTAKDGQADTVHANLGGQRINGASVELLCDPGEKMKRLSQIAELGDRVDDFDVFPPSLEDIYRHYATEDQP